MAISYNTIASNSTPAHPLAINPGATLHDVLITGVVTDTTSTGSPFAETGFDQIALQSITIDGQNLAVLRKKDATGSEGSLNISDPSSAAMIGFTMAISGADNTTPENVISVEVSNNTADPAPAVIDGTIVPTTNGCMIVAVMGIDALSSADDPVAAFSTITGTTGAWTVRGDYHNGFYNIAVATCVQATAGSITVRGQVSSMAGNAGRSMVLIAIKPAAAGGGITTPPLPKIIPQAVHRAASF